MRKTFAALGCIALLAACNSSEDAVEEVQTAEAPSPINPNAPVTQAADGTAVAEGSWDVSESSDGASAVFAAASGGEQLAIRCNTADKVVTLSMAGAAEGEQAWRVDAGGEAARVDMTASLTEAGRMVAEIEPTLALFHAFAIPQQTVAFTSPDGMKTYYPTHPGIDRVLYACS